MAAPSEAPAVLPQKPLLRGWSHLVAFGAAILAGGALTLSAPGQRAVGSALIYSGCLAAMFGASALYHRPMWTPRARAWMRRLDHSGIFLLIAGTLTPVTLVLPHRERTLLLVFSWTGAAVGCARALLWVKAPKLFVAVSYLVVAWTPLFLGRALYAGLGAETFAWLLVGGILYTVGAACYALKRPAFWPLVFGYHEFFHLLVVLAAGCHFVAVARVLSQLR